MAGVTPSKPFLAWTTTSSKPRTVYCAVRVRLRDSEKERASESEGREGAGESHKIINSVSVGFNLFLMIVGSVLSSAPHDGVDESALE